MPSSGRSIRGRAITNGEAGTIIRVRPHSAFQMEMDVQAGQPIRVGDEVLVRRSDDSPSNFEPMNWQARKVPLEALEIERRTGLPYLGKESEVMGDARMAGVENRRATIRKQFTFEASHVLPEHQGKCSRLHGHSYLFEVEVSGPIMEEAGSARGMVVDFGDLSAHVDYSILANLDHRHLNDLPQFSEGAAFYPPSAENIAAWIHSVIAPTYSPEPVKIRVWEGRKASAEVGP